jgi:predicted metal-dependent RNase
MSTQDSTSPLEEDLAALEAEIPPDLIISDVAYEGPQLVIYTETPRKFAKQDGLIGHLASTVRKRVTTTSEDEFDACLLTIALPDELDLLRVLRL